MPCQCGCCTPEDTSDEALQALQRAKEEAERRAEAAEKRLAELTSGRS